MKFIKIALASFDNGPPGYPRALQESRQRYRDSHTRPPSRKNGGIADGAESGALQRDTPTPTSIDPPTRMQVSEPGIRTNPAPYSMQGVAV